MFLLVTRVSKEVLGVNDVVFAFLVDSVTEVLYTGFVYLPMLVVQTKIVPKDVEGTVYSVFGSLRNVASNTVSPMVGGVIAQGLGVTKDDFGNIGLIVVFQL